MISRDPDAPVKPIMSGRVFVYGGTDNGPEMFIIHRRRLGRVFFHNEPDCRQLKWFYVGEEKPYGFKITDVEVSIALFESIIFECNDVTWRARDGVWKRDP